MLRVRFYVMRNCDKDLFRPNNSKDTSFFGMNRNGSYPYSVPRVSYRNPVHHPKSTSTIDFFFFFSSTMSVHFWHYWLSNSFPEACVASLVSELYFWQVLERCCDATA